MIQFHFPSNFSHNLVLNKTKQDHFIYSYRVECFNHIETQTASRTSLCLYTMAADGLWWMRTKERNGKRGVLYVQTEQMIPFIDVPGKKYNEERKSVEISLQCRWKKEKKEIGTSG